MVTSLDETEDDCDEEFLVCLDTFEAGLGANSTILLRKLLLNLSRWFKFKK